MDFVVFVCIPLPLFLLCNRSLCTLIIKWIKYGQVFGRAQYCLQMEFIV